MSLVISLSSNSNLITSKVDSFWLPMKSTLLPIRSIKCCQTLGLVLRLRVDFVLPLSQEQQEEQEEQQPLTKIYQKGVY